VWFTTLCLVQVSCNVNHVVLFRILHFVCLRHLCFKFRSSSRFFYLLYNIFLTLTNVLVYCSSVKLFCLGLSYGSVVVILQFVVFYFVGSSIL